MEKLAIYVFVLKNITPNKDTARDLYWKACLPILSDETIPWQFIQTPSNNLTQKLNNPEYMRMGNSYVKLNVAKVENLVKDHLEDIYIYKAPDIDWTPCPADIMVYYRRLSDRAKDDFHSGYICNREYALTTLVFHAIRNLIVELLGFDDILRFPNWKNFSWTWDSSYVHVYHKKVKEAKLSKFEREANSS